MSLLLLLVRTRCWLCCGTQGHSRQPLLWLLLLLLLLLSRRLP
jgi:MYXO-CTERM domain-containing protein